MINRRSAPVPCECSAAAFSVAVGSERRSGQGLLDGMTGMLIIDTQDSAGELRARYHRWVGENTVKHFEKGFGFAIWTSSSIFMQLLAR